jgi:hypothetical protein
MNKIIHPIEPEELMAYLDGELTADRAAATAAHLGECAECQSLVAELRKVSQDLKSWEVEALEPGVSVVVATALAEKQSESQKGFRTFKPTWRELLRQRWTTIAWAGTAAAVLVLVFSAVTPNMLRSRSSTEQARQFGRVQQYAKLAPAAPPPPAASPRSAVVAPSTSVASTDSSGFSHGLGDSGQSLSMNGRPAADEDKSDDSEPPTSAVPPVHGPMIIRTAQLTLITKEFDKARANLEALLKQHRGFVGELKVGGNTGSGRTLTATLRVPADQLDGMLSDAKKLGRVESETQGGQDTTSEYVDLQARLSNAHNTAQRLTEILRNRTGKLADVLAVEQELDRVRGEIEQMEAERKTMLNQVSYATLTATITEDYQAQLQAVPPSTSTRLGNAAVEGYRNMIEGILSVALFLLSSGPTLLLWGAILFMPSRLVWKKLRRSLAS